MINIGALGRSFRINIINSEGHSCVDFGLSFRLLSDEKGLLSRLIIIGSILQTVLSAFSQHQISVGCW